ncbi:MAG: zf-HC2 domain-containing protein [Dehalococcoidia bacterium]
MARFFTKHTAYEVLLTEHLDGKLDAAGEADLQAHVETCERCARDLRDMAPLVAVLRSEPMVEAPRSFALPLDIAHPSQAHAPDVQAAPGGLLRWAGASSLAMLRSMQVATAAAALLLVALVGLDLSGVMAPEPLENISQLSASAEGAAADDAGMLRTSEADDAEVEGREGQGDVAFAPPNPQPEAGGQPGDMAIPMALSSEPAPGQAEGRSVLEWAKLVLSALTAFLAMGVVGLTWQIYRRPLS